MDELIKKQLLKCKVAQIPEFNDDTTELIIKKSSIIIPHENECYLIELDDNLIDQSNKSTLTLNWNHGSIPKYKFYKVDILKIMAQMIKINGIAFDFINNHDIDEIWSGWLPLNSIKILEKI